MAERPPNLPGDADLRIAEITSQFETEWQQAVAGQLRPCVETHLDRIEETQRENLRRALEKRSLNVTSTEATRGARVTTDLPDTKLR